MSPLTSPVNQATATAREKHDYMGQAPFVLISSMPCNRKRQRRLLCSSMQLQPVPRFYLALRGRQLAVKLCHQIHSLRCEPQDVDYNDFAQLPPGKFPVIVHTAEISGGFIHSRS
jgi:hypothetical protein